jgi:hypothetical protein
MYRITARWAPRAGRLTLNRGYMALLNVCLWEDAGRFVVAHPSDRVLIEKIDSGAEIRLDPAGRIASGGSASSETERRAGIGWSARITCHRAG